MAGGKELHIDERQSKEKRMEREKNICDFCSEQEYADHLFFTFPLAKHVRNIASFTFGSDFVPSLAEFVNKVILAPSVGVERKFILIGYAAICGLNGKQGIILVFRSVKPGDPTNVDFFLPVGMGEIIEYLQRLLRQGARRVAKVA